MDNIQYERRAGGPSAYVVRRRSDGARLGRVYRGPNGRWHAYNLAGINQLGNVRGYPTRDEAAGVLVRRAAALNPEK